MAFLRKKKSKYYGVFFDATRKPKEKWVPLKTGLKDAAKKKLNDLERRWLDPDDPWTPWTPIAPVRYLTVVEAVDEFMASRKHLRPRSQETYEGVLRRFCQRLPVGLMHRDLSAHHLNGFINDPSVLEATRRKRYRNVRAFLKWTVKADFIPKSGSERPIPLVGDALEVLTRLAEQGEERLDAYVFTGFGGGRLNLNHVSRRFKHYVRLARLPGKIRFLSLRHTCASWLVQRGVSLPIVQAILGHSTIRVTQRYAHLAPDVMQAAMLQAFGNGSGVPE